jgi:hypothetical protein
LNVMQKQSGIKWQGVGLILTLLFVALLVSVNVPSTVLAQDDTGPTPTPDDPIWRAFSTARDALEEEHSVDLTLVRKWMFNQEEYVYGIDYECIEDIPLVNVRPVYFGWTFRIIDLSGGKHQARVSFDLRAVAVCTNYTEVDGFNSDPDPAAVDPNLPAPVAGSGATGAFELGGQVWGFSDEVVTKMGSAGMTWAKRQARYHIGDSGGSTAGMISQAHGYGFKILVSAVGEPSQMASSDYDSYVAGYAKYVGEIAASGADAIEVWNEANIDREWPTGQVNGARYTQLLAASYNAIKTANPNTIVVSGAPAPTGYAGSAGCIDALCNDDVFMQQMASAGAANYMDCVGLHYNEGIMAPSANAGDPRGEYPTYYFGSMLQRGYGLFGGLPVCWTELGYLTAEGMGSAIPGGFAWAENVTLAQQAAWLADAAARSAQNGNVRMMIVWNVNLTAWDTDPQGGYAIMRPDSTCPACSTLGAVMGG